MYMELFEKTLDLLNTTKRTYITEYWSDYKEVAPGTEKPFEDKVCYLQDPDKICLMVALHNVRDNIQTRLVSEDRDKYEYYWPISIFEAYDLLKTHGNVKELSFISRPEAIRVLQTTIETLKTLKNSPEGNF